MNYWWTSDYHFSHFNIIRYCGRPFETAEEMIDVSAHWHGLKMTPKTKEELAGLRALCQKQKIPAPEPVQPKDLELVEA